MFRKIREWLKKVFGSGSHPTSPTQGGGQHPEPPPPGRDEQIR
jgi:hypothetical protein